MYHINTCTGCSMWLTVSGCHSYCWDKIHFDRVKAAILDTIHQYIMPHHGHEAEQVHIIANCDWQSKLNKCIRHHHGIME